MMALDLSKYFYIHMCIKMDVTNDVFKQFKQFLIENDVVGSCSATCIGLATKDAVLSLFSDILVPVVTILLLSLQVNWLSKWLPTGNKINGTKFAKKILTWLIVLAVTFAFVKLSFSFLFNIYDTKNVEYIK
jgi:large-conductance mechanosensitive channel